jgi:hypothetical protein
MSDNVKRLPTCRSEEAVSECEAAPERRHVPPAYLLSAAWSLPRRASRAAALRQLSSYLMYNPYGWNDEAM